MSSPPEPSHFYSGSPAAAQPGRVPQNSIPELLQDIVSNVQDMIRGEFRLVRAEMREEAARALPAAKILILGLFAALYGAGFLLLAAVYGLATIFENWFAALLVGMVLAIAAAALIGTAMSHFRLISPAPDQTIRTLEENAPWAKDRMK